MIIHHGSSPVPPALRNGVVAIGNFDGVHRGHQVLFELARRRALELGVPFVVLTFDPHPRRFFRPESDPFLITPHDTKMERIHTSMADGVVILSFDHGLATQTADQFITHILRTALSARHIFVGRDFHFGLNRAGTVDTLRQAGFDVTSLDLMCDHAGTPYSSTRVRSCLQEGHIALANQLLGWNWDIRGDVVHGDKRGRELGFPTANIPMLDMISPSHGIYAARVHIAGDANIWRDAAINIGLRPMFATDYTLLEAHILDFDGDLYDQTLHIQPVQKLRDEAKFPSLAALVAQMREDCIQARDILRQVPFAA